MKIKYTLLLFILSISFGLTGCSDDDDNPDVENPTPRSELTIENDSIVIKKDISDIATVEIKEGAGDYNIYSLDTNIATVELSDNKIQIKATGWGKTSVIISDKDANMKRIGVEVRYENLTLSKQNLTLEYPLGRQGSANVDILTGNQDYTVESEDEEIAKAELVNDKDAIKITALGIEGGKTNIIITDALGCKAVLPVTTQSTLEPYSEAELENILAMTSNTYNFNGTGTYYSYTNIKTIEDGINVYGWEYNSFLNYYLKLYFPGDKSVGEKPGSQILYKYSGISITEQEDLEIFRIIKNDGEKIWAVFSYIRDEMVYPGYFIQDI